MEYSQKLETCLRRLSQANKMWKSDPVDDQGLLHIMNKEGQLPPIFWCFNTAREFPLLAEALGANQPIIGMRSLHTILDPTDIDPFIITELGELYANLCIRYLNIDSCIVGGNCQAAHIAYKMALRLKTFPVNVLRLVTLDAELRLPYPGEVRALFGRDSNKHNPFFQKEISPSLPPLLHWRFAYKNANPIIVDGGHGRFFEPSNITSFAKALTALSNTKQNTCPLSELPVWKILAQNGNKLTLTTQEQQLDLQDIALVPLWENQTSKQVSQSTDWIVRPLRKGQNWTCSVNTPTHEGAWVLQLVLCHIDTGPMTWPPTKFQSMHINI